MIAVMSDSLMHHFQSLPRRSREFAVGQFLFHQGDPIVSLFWIDEGIAQLQRISSDGASAVMQRAMPVRCSPRRLFSASTIIATQWRSKPSRPLSSPSPTFAE